MAKITLGQAAQWCGGKVAPQYEEIAFSGANIDSRKIAPGELFVAVVAARDGHDFIPGAMERGAAAVLCSRPVPGVPSILVEDTRLALGRMAAGYLRHMGAKVVGVTGSVGKSTTKEMIYAVLKDTYRVSKTPANHNNDLGLPAAVLAMEPDTQVAVLEMGMSHFGEIAYLSELARPDIGVIVNIGTMHIENLGSQGGILQAKLEITKGMQADGKLILYGDDPYLRNCKTQLPRLYFGQTDPICAVRARQVHEENGTIGFTVSAEDTHFAVSLPLEGRHYVPDALAAVSVGLALQVPPETIAYALAHFQTMAGRQEIFTVCGCTVISDCYNAGPESMAAALGVLGNRQGRRIAVLGDMLELGDRSEEAHQAVGALAAEKADILMCFGDMTKQTVQAAKATGMSQAWHYETREALSDALAKLHQTDDVVLFKGSRGMKMELCLEQFIHKTKDTK